MKRYLYQQVLNDLSKKMVFITGPRQVGKTYLAKQLMANFSKPQYLNYDVVTDRQLIENQQWRLDSDLLVFDEIHKMKNFKNFLKGVYDSRFPNQAILVTGSARLETFRQTGESLAGRYLHLRLFPISIPELSLETNAFNHLELLMKRGGFPEPLLSESESDAARWRNQYYVDLIREDIVEFSRIQEINTMRMLLELLRERAGSPLSYQSLANDLHVAPNTIKKYLRILESLYIIFLLPPYYQRLSRSIKKEPKLYFYDSGYLKTDIGGILENTVAVSLLKYVRYMKDALGEDMDLYYAKTKTGHEVDFIITKNQSPSHILEVKHADPKPTASLRYMASKFPEAQAIQLVHQLRQEQDHDTVLIRRACDYLATLPA